LGQVFKPLSVHHQCHTTFKMATT